MTKPRLDVCEQQCVSQVDKSWQPMCSVGICMESCRRNDAWLSQREPLVEAGGASEGSLRGSFQLTHHQSSTHLPSTAPGISLSEDDASVLSGILPAGKCSLSS